MGFRWVTLLALSQTPGAAASWQSERQESGKNPLRKVVTLLQNLAEKVDAEGEREKKLYEEFVCYCKNGEASLSESISANNAKMPTVQSDIEAAESEVAQLEQDLKSHFADRDAAKQAIAEATSLREKEHQEFVKESTEMQGYLDALAKAIPAIESGMSGTKLLQTTAAAAALKFAVASDEQLTDDDRQSIMVFLGTQAADGYTPSSGEIVGILKTMQEDYKKDLDSITSTEEEAAKTFDELVAAKTKEEKTLSASIEKKTARVGEAKVEVVKMKQDLTEAEAQLVQDKKMLADLDTNCKAAAVEFDKRTQLRSQELVAIQDTIKILNDDDALELFKKTLPSPGSFVQVKSRHEAAREHALASIRKYLPKAEGRPEIQFLELRLMSKKVDFSKVIKMIDDMVALLNEEMKNDKVKRDYCNKELDMVDGKVKGLEKNIADFEVAIDESKERIANIADEIKNTKAGIEELDRLVAEETATRKKENEEFTELMSENTAAKELLEFAKNRLNKFYNPSQYKAPPKKEEALLTEDAMFAAASPDEPILLQKRHERTVSVHRAADPLGPAPKPFAEDSGKKSEESNGIIGMIDSLINDLSREMQEAEFQEKEAQKDYETFMADSAKKRAKDVKAIAIKDSSKAEAEQMKIATESSLREETDELQATSTYQQQVHVECDWLLKNFDLRKEARKDEIDNLSKAKSILSGADFSLMQQSKPSSAFLKASK